MRQADYDLEVALAQASAFPEHKYLNASSAETNLPLRSWNSRNLDRLSIVDRHGRCRGRHILNPASHEQVCGGEIWLLDGNSVIQGLLGLE